VILAAGESRRMGSPSSCCEAGKSMVRWVTRGGVRGGLGAGGVVIAHRLRRSGRHWRGTRGAGAQRAVAEGMTTSLHAGLRALRPEIRAGW